MARHRILFIAIIVALAGGPERVSKTSAPAVPVTGAVSSKQYPLIGLGAVRASFAEGEGVVVNGQHRLRQDAKVTVTSPGPMVARQAKDS